MSEIKVVKATIKKVPIRYDFHYQCPFCKTKINRREQLPKLGPKLQTCPNVKCNRMFKVEVRKSKKLNTK